MIKSILLVEDNPGDVRLTKRDLMSNKIWAMGLDSLSLTGFAKDYYSGSMIEELPGGSTACAWANGVFFNVIRLMVVIGGFGVVNLVGAQVLPRNEASALSSPAAVPKPAATNSTPAGVSATPAPAAAAETSPAPPREPSYLRFTRLTTEDGLSRNDVRAMAQDPQGFMWFGTALGGLNRYDGYEFKVYSHSDRDPRSLGNNTVWSLLVDRAGVLWVGTRRGLSRLNPDGKTFTTCLYDANDPHTLRHNSVRGMTEDPATGCLWLSSPRWVQLFDLKTVMRDAGLLQQDIPLKPLFTLPAAMKPTP